ncbi:hypothetical protein [Altererythrobacter sp. Root672]|uniref:hypothetical protein n=1 Tax=Altererythrobacter sp. Root672 TaxID=1736584 RepID=UPI0006F76992|nr:hypothetical protein [Altererythrobacter sp. Root672]KRA79704.1 hypothetical protein ASD76_16905 [Altererythrobacter sp. Root672]
MSQAGYLALGTAVLAGVLSGCQPVVRPNIEAGSTTPSGLATLQQVECDAVDRGAPLPVAYQGMHYVPQAEEAKEIAGLAAVLLTSLIGKGVDLLGSRLTSRGEERTLTLAAQMNISDYQMQVSCFELWRQDGLLVRFALLPNVRQIQVGDKGKNTDYTILEAKVVSLNYPRSIDQSSTGVRGLELKIEGLHANESDPVSQSISFGNVEVGANLVSIPFDNNPFTSAYFQSPFVREGEDPGEAKAQPRVDPNLPFTLRVELTEVRNANELYKLGGEVLGDNSDAIAEALVKALSSKEEAAASGGPDPVPTEQPPGGGNN